MEQQPNEFKLTKEWMENLCYMKNDIPEDASEDIIKLWKFAYNFALENNFVGLTESEIMAVLKSNNNKKLIALWKTFKKTSDYISRSGGKTVSNYRITFNDVNYDFVSLNDAIKGRKEIENLYLKMMISRINLNSSIVHENGDETWNVANTIDLLEQDKIFYIYNPITGENIRAETLEKLIRIYNEIKGMFVIPKFGIQQKFTNLFDESVWVFLNDEELLQSQY